MMIRFLLSISLVALFLSCSSIPDGKIQNDIVKKLTVAEMNEVSVIVQNGDAILTGEVADDAFRNQAEVLAKTVEGVKSIQNRIVVLPPLPEFTIDAETAKEPPSPYEEAQQEAEQYWNRYIFRCGESDFIYSYRPADPNVPSRYYDKPLDIYIEMRNFYVSVDGEAPTPKSEADRLNEQNSPTGIQWSGNTSAYASPRRIYLSQDTPDAFTSNGWNKWREESDPVFKVGMSKVNGNWSFGELRAQGAHGPGPLKKAECQQVPGS